MKPFKISFLILATLLTACKTPTGENLASNVYSTDQVNQKQESKTIEIIAISPAKIKMENKENKQAAQLLGGLAGGIGGGILGHNVSDKYDKEGAVIGGVGGAAIGATAATALVDGEVLVDAVTLSYIHDEKTLSSTQVGKICEFKQGTALMIITQANETRIQPNATCPVEQKK
jgi:outer membrane lipoprotein SlyB